MTRESDRPSSRTPDEMASAGVLQDGRLLRLSIVARAWNATFSRGPSYENVPRGRNVEPGAVTGYYVDFSAKTTAATDPERLLPAALAQLGLGWWERSLEGERHAEDRYLRVCSMLLDQAMEADGELRWIYNIPVAKYRVFRPFCSALAQGQIASLFVRAHRATGDASLATAARRAIKPLLADKTTDLVTLTPDGRILEESPTEPRSHILNGWISGLWGLLDVALVFDDASAMAAFEEGSGVLDAVLHHYDVGWWTKYSLYPTVLPDLAKPIYHRFHIDQMHVLADLTGNRAFEATAMRWADYDTLAHRARFVAQKARYVFRFSRGRLALRQPSVLALP